MKPEQKRYFLVEYLGTYTKVYQTREEVDAVLKNVDRFNQRKTQPFIYGNISIKKVPSGYELTSHVYNKLTQRTEISVLDRMTSEFDEHELIVNFKDAIRSLYPSKLNVNYPILPDINIAYFEDKNEDERDDSLLRRIKYIPVLYKDDKDVLKRDTVKNAIVDHAREHRLDFFRDLVKKFEYNRMCDNELDELERAIDRVVNQDYPYGDLVSPALDLYDRVIYEYERNGRHTVDNRGYWQKSRRRQRDFGFFVRDYDSLRPKSPLRYNYSMNKITQAEIDAILKDIESINNDKNNPVLAKK